MRERTAGPRPRCYGRLIPSFLLAAVLVLAACGARPVATPPFADSGPDRPGAGGAALVVDGQALAAPVVLDPMPSGLGVWGVRYNPSDDGYPPQRATLYGDPSFADTLDGPLVLVGTSEGSASLGGPPGRADDGESVDLGSKDGFLIRSGDLTWIGIPGTTTWSSWSAAELTTRS